MPSRSAAAIQDAKNALKMAMKNMSPRVGSFLLSIGGAKVNKTGYETRILVAFGGGIGDVVKRSVICEYVKEYLSGYDVYHLMPYDIRFPHVAETIHFDYTKSKINPWYYFKTVNRLRKIGFVKVIVLLPAWEGFLSTLGKDIMPDVVYRYVEVPPKELVGRTASLAGAITGTSTISRDVPTFSFFDSRWAKSYFPSDTHKVAYFFSQVICDITPEWKNNLDRQGLLDCADARTEVDIPSHISNPLSSRPYCVVGIGSSYRGKNWSPEKFGETAAWIAAKGFDIVLVGGPETIGLKPSFAAALKGPFQDFVNKTTLEELCAIMRDAALVLANDTSFTHLAIAFQKPTVCVAYGRSVGADSHYGYKDINRWIFGEDMEKIDVASVEKALEENIREIGLHHGNRERFALSFFEQ